MEIVQPRIIVPVIDGIQIMKRIEQAGRTCYRSEGTTEDSYKNFIKNCINRGHESVIEHEKITVRLVVDRGTMWDITRHRHCSFSIESTRYCNYSKNKFNNEIKVINPFFLIDKNQEDEHKFDKYNAWKKAIEQSEKSYFDILSTGGSPDYARMVLPASLATEICMTANIREWRHIFSLRCQNTVHPHVRQVMIPLLLHFKSLMPELFDDIPYDEEFAQKYQDDLVRIEIKVDDLQSWALEEMYDILTDNYDDDDYNLGFNRGEKYVLNKVLEYIYPSYEKELEIEGE